MPKTAARLLGVQESPLIEAITKLEHLSGYHGEDIHLLADTEAAARRQVASLGLDPQDTTGRELYHALLTRYEADNSHLEVILGQKSKSSLDKRLQRVVEFASHAKIPRDTWVVKRSVAKELLRAHPPRKLMKFLHYRSIDSMLKRTDIAELYAGLPLVESTRWLNVFWRLHTKLASYQFETRRVEVLAMRTAKWEKLAAKTPVISMVSQLGGIALWPSSVAMRIGTLGLAAWTLQATGNLRANNAFLKLRQFQPDFGNLLIQVWRDSAAPAAFVGDLPVSWRNIQAHYGKTPATNHPAALEPHVQPEDLYWHSASQALAALCVAGQWWANGDQLAILYKSGPVSMNLLDMAANRAANLPYKRRKAGAFQAAFRDELIHRYLMNPSVEDYLLTQLEETASEDEMQKLIETDFVRRAGHQVRTA